MQTTSKAPPTVPTAASTSWSALAATVFSFPVMCMFLLVAVIFGFSKGRIAEPDIWWHLRNAAYLFQHHSFPSVDMYSFGAAGSPWLNYEWLSEIPFFLGFKAMGLQGLLAVYFAVLVLIYTGVYYRSCRAGADCKRRCRRHFSGYSARGRVHRSSHAAVWLAVHGGAAAGAGSFSADRKRPLAVAAFVCPVDQSARFLGLWHGGLGADNRLRSGGRRVGPGGGTALVSGGVEETAAGVGGFAGRTLGQPLWLQAGAVPIRPTFPPQRLCSISKSGSLWTSALAMASWR